MAFVTQIYHWIPSWGRGVEKGVNITKKSPWVGAAVPAAGVTRTAIPSEQPPKRIHLQGAPMEAEAQAGRGLPASPTNHGVNCHSSPSEELQGFLPHLDLTLCTSLEELHLWFPVFVFKRKNKSKKHVLCWITSKKIWVILSIFIMKITQPVWVLGSGTMVFTGPFWSDWVGGHDTGAWCHWEPRSFRSTLVAPPVVCVLHDPRVGPANRPILVTQVPINCFTKVPMGNKSQSVQ